jgi:hypothetical protein
VARQALNGGLYHTNTFYDLGSWEDFAKPGDYRETRLPRWILFPRPHRYTFAQDGQPRRRNLNE